jgi:hypothetical protein
MGQYKVPQDVEAEDKIIGPLTLRQFIYAVIGIMWGGLCFVIFRSVLPIMIVVGAPITLLFLLLAFYRRDGQNFEQLLVAMAGYFGQTRRRLWVKEPIVEAFQIVPPKVTSETTQRNPAEVRSQLDQLASVIDSRGGTPTAAAATEDRLYMPTQPAPQQAAEPEQPDRYDVPVAGDPLAQLIEQSVANLRSGAIEQMRQEVGAPAAKAPVKPSASAMTVAPSGDIIRLATENDDLSVSQIAAQAGRQAAPLAEGESVTLRNVPNQSK